MIIFTDEIAFSLLERGFELEYKTDTAWCFKDVYPIEEVVNELLIALESSERSD